MPFEWFMLWSAGVMIAASIATPFILKRVDRKTSDRINGRKEQDK